MNKINLMTGKEPMEIALHIGKTDLIPNKINLPIYAIDIVNPDPYCGE